jgi:signal transduction histidine kinase
VDRALDLVGTLRTHLKDEQAVSEGGSLRSAFEHVEWLLQAQFGGLVEGEVQLRIEPEVGRLRSSVPLTDLIHIFHNLMANSMADFREHARVGPQLHVSLVSCGGSRAVVRVSDNGSGLTAESFESLTGMTMSPSPQAGGSLGLRLVRRLIERHGGALRVEEGSGPGVGTAFWVELPVV